MRMLLNVKLPHQPFNAAVKNGTAGSMLSRILEAIKPEAVYFTEQNGQRGAVLIVDLPDPSKIPALAEPWFLTFEADVEFRVVMSPDDLKRAGLDELGKQMELICAARGAFAQRMLRLTPRQAGTNGGQAMLISPFVLAF